MNQQNLTALILLVSISQIFGYASLITDNHHWFIASPLLFDSHNAHTEKSILLSHMETIEKLGKQAHEIWQHTPHSPERLKAYEHNFQSVNHDFLSNLIDEVLTNEALLQEIAERSYRNVLGFLKIVLATGGRDDAWKMRLHVWHKTEEKEFPHNHKWDFYSKIISGYLTQHVYEKNTTCATNNIHSVREPVSLMPVGTDGQLPCPCRDSYVLNPKEDVVNQSVGLTVQSTTIIGNGESYIMPHHLTHTIDPGTHAISLVFTSERKVENSEVFVPLEKADTDLSKFAPSVTIDELRNELCNIKKQLQKLHIQPCYLPEMTNANHDYYSVYYDDPIIHASNWRTHIQQNPSNKQVVQLSPHAYEYYRVSSDHNGCIQVNNEPIDPTHDYLFTLNNNTMYACPKNFHHEGNKLVCHTSFTDYAPVDSVGVLRFNESGMLTAIEAYSGHYGPSVAHMNHACEYLARIGVDTQHAQLIEHERRNQS